MTITILSEQYCGPYYARSRQQETATTLGELIKSVRGFFEENVDAIAIIKDDKVIGAWINEPDIDCDGDGFYEVSPAYLGQNFNLYRPDRRGFWNAFVYHFGTKYVPHGTLFDTQGSIAA